MSPAHPGAAPEGARPARSLVTGAAGFIGSHLCEALLARGDRVVGVDCFTDTYPRPRKESHLREARRHPAFEFVERDLSTGRVDDLLEDVDVVFHLGAQAGVRPSFGEGFADYLRHNVQTTQRLLEASRTLALRRFVYASSSSVYGNPTTMRSAEGDARRPCSPYGLSKVATEDLAEVYHRTAGLPVVGMRYFTVYGPRQRPDMAFAGFLGRALCGRALRVFGDGRQMRDFTYVADAVRATIAASELGEAGSVYNVGGGTPVTLAHAIQLLGEALGARLEIQWEDVARGDVVRTCADGRRARQDLGFVPEVRLADGLREQVRWTLDGLGETASPAGVRRSGQRAWA